MIKELLMRLISWMLITLVCYFFFSLIVSSFFTLHFTHNKDICCSYFIFKSLFTSFFIEQFLIFIFQVRSRKKIYESFLVRELKRKALQKCLQKLI